MTTVVGTLESGEACYVNDSTRRWTGNKTSSSLTVYSDPNLLGNSAVEIGFLHSSFPTFGYVDGANLWSYTSEIASGGADDYPIYGSDFPCLQLRSGVSLDLYENDGTTLVTTLSGGDWIALPNGASETNGPAGESYPTHMGVVSYCKSNPPYETDWLAQPTEYFWLDTGITKYGSGYGYWAFLIKH